MNVVRQGAKATIKMLLRLPPDMHERIKKLAEQEDRSFHGQVIALLRDALKRARLKGES